MNSPQSTNPHRVPIPRTVWILGWMMFLINLSYVMFFSFAGVYLKTIVGVSTIWIGLLEGFAEASSYAMKLFSGMLSDFLRRRKLVMLVGYALSVFSRPVLAFGSTMSSFAMVSAARMMERIGNGIQATPRDAIVADVAPSKRIGASYGLKRSLGTAGSFFGAVCGYYAMVWTNDSYQKVFWLATIPAFLAFAILIFFVKEPKRFDHPAVSAEVPLPIPKRKHPALNIANLALLGRTFWLLMLVNSVFMLSRFGETFLILHGHNNFGIPARLSPLVMMLFNVGWCMSSYPVGVLADRMNRYTFLSFGITFLILSDFLLSQAHSLSVFGVGVLFWGIQYGMTQNVFLSLTVESVPEDLRGTGLGCYYIILSISAFLADTMAGVISQHYGETRAFMVSGLIALVALMILTAVMGQRTQKIVRKG